MMLGCLQTLGCFISCSYMLYLPSVNPCMCIYGDPAYPLRVELQAPYRNAILTADMQAFNTSMSEVRVAVEWLFGDIVNYFKFIDYKKNLKSDFPQISTKWWHKSKKSILFIFCS